MASGFHEALVLIKLVCILMNCQPEASDALQHSTAQHSTDRMVLDLA